MPVTNKLLIPCRVLDSHFYRLSDSVLCPSFPPSPSVLPSQDSSLRRYLLPFSIRESRFSPTATQPLPLLPMYTLLPFLQPRLASATHPLNDRHPTLSTPLSWLLSLFVLFSPSVLLLYKSQRGLYARTDVPSVGLERTESRSKEKLRVVRYLSHFLKWFSRIGKRSIMSIALCKQITL